MGQSDHHLWSMLKRGYYGTFHKLSPKLLDRYVLAFAGRHSLSELDTIDMMGAVVLGMDGKRLKYEDLIGDNGLDSGARGAAPWNGTCSMTTDCLDWCSGGAIRALS